MPNGHIDANIDKTISPTIGTGISQDTAARRALVSFLEHANKPLDYPPLPSLEILSNILHNTVSAVIAVLDASRPRVLRLARSVSSWKASEQKTWGISSVLICFLWYTIILGSSNLDASAQNVNFPDANLAAKVRTVLGLGSTDPIPETNLAGLTQLLAIKAGVTDITGLEKAVGLTELHLNGNQISDITPLASLTGLTRLEIGTNPISDHTPVQNLTNLEILSLRKTQFSNSDITILSPLTSLSALRLDGNEISDLTNFPSMPSLTLLHLDENQIRDITPLANNLANPTQLRELGLSGNQISDFTPLASFTGLQQLFLNKSKIKSVTPLASLTALQRLDLSGNQISDLTPLSSLTALKFLFLHDNQISDLTPLSSLTALRTLYFYDNQVRDLTPLSSLPALRRLHFHRNRIRDLTPLSSLTELTDLRFHGNPISDLTLLAQWPELTILSICYTPYTDISPIANLPELRYLLIDEEFVNANRELVEATTTAELILCPPLLAQAPELKPAPAPAPAPTPEVKQRRIIMTQCGLGWSPQPQYQHHRELPKVMIYALEFEYDPGRHGKYICKTIEIRTGDDTIKNLAGWNLYLGTLYNPSNIPMTIPEEHSQITGRILRITPEMLGLETFPCNTVNVVSHPLPGVHYVLKTDENVLVDTAYTCFVWGQIATTKVNGINVKSPRRVSSAALREMETPRLERYISNNTDVFITYMDIEAFTWDRFVLSDWLLPLSESSAPGAPSTIQRKPTTTWGALKKK